MRITRVVDESGLYFNTPINLKMANCNNLVHYGVKGMKRGVRRTKEELMYNKSSVISSVNRKELKVQTSNGLITCRMSDHTGDRADLRKISTKDILDAIEKTLHTNDVTYDTQKRPSQRYIGRYAVVNLNPIDGTICTVWKTGQRTVKKYLRK